jgi:hypothetical protein
VRRRASMGYCTSLAEVLMRVLGKSGKLGRVQALLVAQRSADLCSEQKSTEHRRDDTNPLSTGWRRGGRTAAKVH